MTLVDLVSPAQLPEGAAGEVRRPEGCDAAREVGVGIGALARRRTCLDEQLVPARRRGAERVVDLEHEPALTRVPTSGEGALHVEHAHEQPVLDHGVQPPRLGDEPQQLLVDGTVLGLHRGDEIDVEHEAPQRRGGVGIDRDQIAHRELVRRHVAAPIVLDRVDGVAAHGAVVALVHGVEARVLLVARALEPQRLPPAVVDGDHARPGRRNMVVDRSHEWQGLITRQHPHTSADVDTGNERRTVGRHLEQRAERGHAVAEAAVDRGLRGPQVGEGLAALRGLVEDRRHQPRVDAPATVRRQHADGGDAGRGQGPPGHGELGRACTGGADDLVAVGRHEPAVGSAMMRSASASSGTQRPWKARSTTCRNASSSSGSIERIVMSSIGSAAYAASTDPASGGVVAVRERLV